MTSNNPYSNLAENAYWKTGVSESDPAQLVGLYTKKFDILTSDTVVAAGSCFAQKISQHLKFHGYRVADYEPRPSDILAGEANQYGYDLYSARYGNIYTVHQLLQLACEAAGLMSPTNVIWEREGRYYDALRPSIQPGGFESEVAVKRSRERHIACVRKMFLEMDVFIFTLGLTESWRHKTTNAIYPVAPGVIAGEFDNSEHEFVNFSLAESKYAFDNFIEVVTQMRQKSMPDFKLILTVSPVPLTATASGDHVLRATTYSKAALRVMAEELRQEHSFIDYFPSYEIITNQIAKGAYYQSNGRSIHESGVSAVMNVFFSEHANTENDTSTDLTTSEGDEHCDEVLLDAFAPGEKTELPETSPILFFGNSHLASFKNCISDSASFAPLSERAFYLPNNWLSTSWFDLRAHDYLRSPILKQDIANLYHPPPGQTKKSETTLVTVGMMVMGDGILRAFGNLKSGNESITDGREISPTVPLLKDEPSNHIKKRYEAFYTNYFDTLSSLINQGVYKDIYIIESPDMIETVGRFRLGDEFVESGSYRHYQRIARSVVREFAENLNITIIGHPESLLGQYGFSKNQYACTDRPYDIHVCGEYYIPALQTLQGYLGVSSASDKTPASQSVVKKMNGLATSLASSISSRIRFS